MHLFSTFNSEQMVQRWGESLYYAGDDDNKKDLVVTISNKREGVAKLSHSLNHWTWTIPLLHDSCCNILQFSLLWSPNAVKCFLGLTTQVDDLFNILCVCVCVCTCPCVCGCIRMGVEAKGQHWISSPITLRLIFWDRVSIEPEAHPS